MKILDRTVVRGFFVNLILWCLVLCGIIIVSDLFTHFDDFFNRGTTVNPLAAIVSYYFFFCLRLADSFLIFLVLISATNILINMFRRNEVIALMALGVPPRRILLPFIGSAVICSLGMCWVRESFIPNRIIKICGSREFFTHKMTSVDLIPSSDEWTDLKIDGESISADGRRINRPVFTLPAPRDSEPRVLRADEAVWHRATAGRGEGYLLRGIRDQAEFFAEGAIDSAGFTRGSAATSASVAEPSDRFDPESILVYAPGEAPGTGPDECFVLCGVPPNFLAVGEEWRSYASTPWLIDALQSSSLPFKPDDLQRQIHRRVMKPISDLFPLLLAMPILFVYKDGNPYKRGIFAALIATLYVGVTYLINFTGRAIFSPTFSAFLPMIFFLPAVLLLFKKLDDC